MAVRGRLVLIHLHVLHAFEMILLLMRISKWWLFLFDLLFAILFHSFLMVFVIFFFFFCTKHFTNYIIDSFGRNRNADKILSFLCVCLTGNRFIFLIVNYVRCLHRQFYRQNFKLIFKRYFSFFQLVASSVNRLNGNCCRKWSGSQRERFKGRILPSAPNA